MTIGCCLAMDLLLNVETTVEALLKENKVTYKQDHNIKFYIGKEL